LTLTPQERLENLLSVPWIKELDKKKRGPCEGLKWKMIGSKHLYPRGGNPALGIPDEARCKRRSRFHYTGGQGLDDFGVTGDYCYAHVVAQLYNDYRRYEKWLNTLPEGDEE
jgi:hypothetical protein